MQQEEILIRGQPTGPDLTLRGGDLFIIIDEIFGVDMP